MLLLPEKYDRSKKIIVMGKGPTAREVARNDDEYYIAAANSAGRLAEHVHFQFAGDGGYCLDALKAYPDKIENLVVPTEFNLENPQRLRSLDFLGDAIPDGVDVFEYIFEFHRQKYPPTDTQRCYNVVSTGEVAIKWLVDEGFREFETVGMEVKSGDRARHPLFVNNGEARILPTGGTWAEQTCTQAWKYVEAAGGSIIFG